MALTSEEAVDCEVGLLNGTNKWLQRRVPVSRFGFVVYDGASTGKGVRLTTDATSYPQEIRIFIISVQRL